MCFIKGKAALGQCGIETVTVSAPNGRVSYDPVFIIDYILIYIFWFVTVGWINA